MNPVAPVNILLSTDLNNLEKVIESGGNLIQANPGTYLFSSKNTNFISLEHVLSDKKAFSIRLVMQDPDNNVIENLLPKNVNEFVQDYGQKADVVLYLMYGIGKNISHHWAGPFVCSLADFNNSYDSAGTSIVEMTFVPDLPVQAILTLENLQGSQVLSSDFLALKGSKKGNKQSSTAIGESYTQVDLGSITYSDTDVGINPTFLNIGISPEEFVDKVELLFQKYAKHWGVDNLFMVYGKEFFDACVKNLYGVEAICGPPRNLGRSQSSYAFSYGTPATLQSAITWLAEFGISLKLIQQDDKLSGQTADDYGSIGPPRKAKTNEGVLVSIDIDENYKRNSSFRQVFDTFYNTLLSESGKPITPQYLIESNTNILKYLKESTTLSRFIKNDEKPLVIIGERNHIRREIYGLGETGQILVPLSDEKSDPAYKQKLQQYYVNKTSHVFRSNYFEDVGGIADDMSYREVIDYDETDPETMLTFKANTVDSNILDFSIDLNLATLKEFTSYFVKKPNTQQREFMIKQIKDYIPNHKKYDIEGFVDDWIRFNYSPNSKFTNVGQQRTVTSKNWKSSYSDYVRNLNDQVFQGTYMAGSIRTLPYFQLSDYMMLDSPCRLIINKNPNLDNYPISHEDAQSFISGDYIIIGFRHVISDTEAYSEFDVMKVGFKVKDLLSEYERSN